MDVGEHSSLIRGAGVVGTIGIAGLMLAGWLYAKGKEDGSANDETSEVAPEELVRSAGIAEVPDAGQASRREREGARLADGQEGQVVSLLLQQDRGQGEPEAQELIEAPFLHQAPQADD